MNFQYVPKLPKDLLYSSNTIFKHETELAVESHCKPYSFDTNVQLEGIELILFHFIIYHADLTFTHHEGRLTSKITHFMTHQHTLQYIDMSKYTNKNNNIQDEIEEGELPDDQPLANTQKESVQLQPGPEEDSPSNEIIFETVTDSEIQSEKKKKKIMKEQKTKKSAVTTKQKQRGYEKEKKNQKSNNRYSQQRQVSPSFNYPNMPPPNPMVKPQNTYLPPPMPQYYPPPQYAYPMMPPVPMPAPYPPYMGSYMHGNMPPAYQYNMGSMPIVQPGQMMPPKPIHPVYPPQMNPQINPQMNTPMNPQMNVPPMNSQMNMPPHYNINPKPKMPMNNPEYYHSQYKTPYGQGSRDWNAQKVDIKPQINPIPAPNLHQRNIQTQQYSDNPRERGRASADRYQKPQKQQKVVSEATKRKNLLQECKSQLRKQLKVFSVQQQLEILQLVKCLTKQCRNQSKEINQISKNNHNKLLNQLEIFCKQSEDKKECIYKILELLQFDWVLMELKEKPLLNWIMKDEQFMKMAELTKSVMDSPLKI